MNTSITVSSPGKLMLFGEHSVVYGHPCIVTSVSERIQVTVTCTDKPNLYLEAPDVGIHAYIKSIDKLGYGDIPKGAQYIEHALNTFIKAYTIESGIAVSTSSSFSPQYGFGSSSASTVCMLYALSQLIKTDISQKDLFTLAYKAVLTSQKKGSGFDVASTIYGGTLLFETGGKTIEPLEINQLPIVVGYSGVKADTKTMIMEVKKKMDMYPEKVERIYEAITQIVKQARSALKESDWKRVGTLMSFNQEYLRDLGVSTTKLEAMISASLKAGAYGAKISGAGGGDCMIALCPENKKEAVQQSVKEAGGLPLPIHTGEPGVRIEKHK